MSTAAESALFTRESTLLRSNVADRVQRDLLPAGRVATVLVVLCELLAEVIVLLVDRGRQCDRPVRAWLAVLMALQVTTVVLNCINIRFPRSDAFHPHRLGLSASDVELYMGASDVEPLTARARDRRPDRVPAARHAAARARQADNRDRDRDRSRDRERHRRLDAIGPSHQPPRQEGDAQDAERYSPMSLNSSYVERYAPSTARAMPIREPARGDGESVPALEEHVRHSTNICGPASSETTNVYFTASTTIAFPGSVTVMSASSASTAPASLPGRGVTSMLSRSQSSHSLSSSDSGSGSMLSRARVAVQSRGPSVDRYMRLLNGWVLVWMILGCVLISDGGTCSSKSPHLYRLAVALTLLYFALLFLPLTCFCLIVCCLPVFIIVYRILLPFSERERRRARAADRDLIQSLPAAPFRPPGAATADEMPAGPEMDVFDDDDSDASCVICLCAYASGDMVKTLPCSHHYHSSCIDQWLLLDRSCPMCKQDVEVPVRSTPDSSGPTVEPSRRASPGESPRGTGGSDAEPDASV